MSKLIVKIFSEKTDIHYGLHVYHHVNFGIKYKDIPNIDLLIKIPKVKRYINSHIIEDEYIIWNTTGWSTCCKEDIWNQVKGTHIAKSKSKI